MLELFYKDPSTTVLSEMYNNLKNRLHEYSHLHHTAKKNYLFRKDFTFKNLILMVLDTFNSAKVSLEKNCYATHCNEVAKISTPFRTRIKFDDEQQTQRRNIFPFQYRKEVKVLFVDLQKNWIKQTKRLKASWKTEIWSHLPDSIDHHKKE